MPAVTFHKMKYTVDQLYQWDLNQVLEIRGLPLIAEPEIHFANGSTGTALIPETRRDADGVISAEVPNVLLQSASKIIAYVCTREGENFRTLYSVEIPVKARPKPADYVYTETEIRGYRVLEERVAKLEESGGGRVNELAERVEELAGQIEGTEIPTKVSQLENDAEYLAKENVPEIIEELNSLTDGEIEFLNALLMGGTLACDPVIEADVTHLYPGTGNHTWKVNATIMGIDKTLIQKVEIGRKPTSVGSGNYEIPYTQVEVTTTEDVVHTATHTYSSQYYGTYKYFVRLTYYTLFGETKTLEVEAT